jgi:hypothetical protein
MTPLQLRSMVRHVQYLSKRLVMRGRCKGAAVLMALGKRGVVLLNRGVAPARNAIVVAMQNSKQGQPCIIEWQELKLSVPVP